MPKQNKVRRFLRNNTILFQIKKQQKGKIRKIMFRPALSHSETSERVSISMTEMSLEKELVTEKSEITPDDDRRKQDQRQIQQISGHAM